MSLPRVAALLFVIPAQVRAQLARAANPGSGILRAAATRGNDKKKKLHADREFEPGPSED